MRQPGNKLLSNYDAPLTQGDLIPAAIFPISASGEILSSGRYESLGVFLLNPESYEESHTTGWVGTPIPGQSLPVYQWVSGGARTITFEALVTKDTSYFNKQSKSKNPVDELASKAINAIGSIASNFLGAPIPTSQLLSTFTKNNGTSFDLDISEQLEYYRSLWKPVYDENRVVQSPSLIYLYSGSTFEDISDSSYINPESQVFILTNLTIKVTKQLPNLAPMEASVTFQLEQYPITSVGIHV